MRKLVAMISVMCAAVLLSASAFGLEIQLGPRTLVLSSGGDQLTIHTNVGFSAVDGVTLDIGDIHLMEDDLAMWADSCGNLVVRCSKEDVEEAVGDFDGLFKEIDVTLTVVSGGAADSDTQVLRVRK